LDDLKLSPDRVIVVPSGAEEQLRPSAVSDAQAHAVKQRFTISQDFILSINGSSQHNAERLLKAYALLPAQLREENRLLVVGAIENDETRQLQRLARLSGLADGE